MNKTISIAFVATMVAAVLLLGSCATSKKVTYFQDLQPGMVEQLSPKNITVKPEDKISIVVKSRDAELSDLFNLPIVTYRVGQGKISSLSSANQQVSLYSVSQEGTIDFPVLGTINVAGKTRQEIAAEIKGMLVGAELVKDPVVTVEFDNLVYSVIGEVSKPGQFSVDRDRVTLLDAISRAGDLTIYGKRDDVMVLRQDGDEMQTYRVNLNEGQSLIQSPVYYLQQNDVVYVAPNDYRQRQSTVNGNNVLSTSFWISVASLLTSIAVLLK